jgi:cytochrome c biogenesis protein CcdA
VIPAFVEGLRASVSPCSLVLIVSIVAVALAVRDGSVFAVVVAGGVAVVTSWSRAAGLAPSGRWAVVLLALLTVSVAGLWWRSNSSPRWARLCVAVIPGALAGCVWQPCVGEVLGEILEGAASRTAASVFLLAAYLFGVIVPALVVALVLKAVNAPRVVRIGRTVGSMVLMAMGVLVLLGLDNRVLGWLAAVSL